jgi:bromodomain-containing protein 7/9
VESGPTTPLPDKKLLLFILDRLQKKDTYGVYSDPVDPEELPDYFEIIKNPMDFSTLRNKLDSGAYSTLEQFERDVFLICTNAMEYNSADTVYYRQARAIQELAKKDFENLRQDSDDEEPQSQQQQQQQPKVARRGRPPKKHPEPSSIDRTASEISADALIPGDSSNKFSGAYNLRKAPPSYKFRQAESSVRINHNSETQSGWSVDWESEFPCKIISAFPLTFFQTFFLLLPI